MIMGRYESFEEYIKLELQAIESVIDKCDKNDTIKLVTISRHVKALTQCIRQQTNISVELCKMYERLKKLCKSEKFYTLKVYAFDKNL